MSDAEEPGESLSQDDVDLIRPLLDDFKSGKKSERKSIIRKAVTKIMGTKDIGHLRPLEQGRTIAHVKECVKSWFHNHGRSRKSKDMVKYVRRWNARQVVGVLHQKEIEQLCRDHSDAVPGEKAYLKSYQKVLKTYTDNLSDDQRAEYHNMATEWSDRSPPLEVQQRTAEVHGAKYIKQFSRIMWRQCGMRLIVLEAHNDIKGELCIASHDFNHELGGETFAEVRPGWQTESIMDEWAHYAQSQMGTDSQDADETALPTTKKKKKTFEFDLDDDDSPILENPSQMIARVMQPMVRQFMSLHYKRISNGKKTFVDWTSLTENQEDMIDHEYLPAYFRFRDPSKMKKMHYQALLEHWYDRQEDENVDIVFAFKGYWDASTDSVVTVNNKSPDRQKRARPSIDKHRKSSGNGKPGVKPSGSKAKGRKGAKVTKERFGPPGIRSGDAGWFSDVEDDAEDVEEDGENEDGDGEDEDMDEEDYNTKRKRGVKSRAPPMPLPFSAQRVGNPAVASKVKPTNKSKSKAQRPAATKGSKPALKKPQLAVDSENVKKSRYPSQPPDLGPQFDRPATRNAGKRKIADAGLGAVGESQSKKAKKGKQRAS